MATRIDADKRGFTPLEMSRTLKQNTKSLTGFTLIELFIAISIFAVVAVALYSTFFAGISVWRRSSESGDIHQDIKFALDDITKDLRNIIYCTEDGESIYAFSGTTEEIAFITLEAPFLQEDISRRELAKIAYRFDKNKHQFIRIRVAKSLGFDIEKGEKEVLLKGIEELKFEYCYFSGDEDEPYLWQEEWEDDESRIPRVVRLTFRIKTKREKEPLEFTKTIFIPIGVLGEEKVGL